MRYTVSALHFSSFTRWLQMPLMVVYGMPLILERRYWLMPLCCQSVIKSIRAGEAKRTSLRRAEYPFCEPGGADSLHRLHTNRRSVGTHTPSVLLPPESAGNSRSQPFPASASAKGITHETLSAKSCATKPTVSLDSSVGQGARAPVG